MESDQIKTSSSDGFSEGLQRMRSLNGRTTGPTRRSTKGQWTAEEDDILCKAVQRFKGKNWKKIAECFKDRTDVQCLHRWQKVLNPELVKGPWSKEEDEIIVQLVNQYGAKKWSAIAQHLPGRIGKQCRERWHNHLNPAINKDAWTQEEELALIRAHQIYGNKWAELTKFLPGRTDNSIKNHWNSSVKKKLDSYLASGLLSQFQGLPHVSHKNQSTPTGVQQCSGDDSILKDSQAEEISECSQGSTFVDCSQSTNEMENSVRHSREECQLAEESSHGKDPSSSPVSCSENYYKSVQEVAFTMSEACELGGSSNFIENRFSDDWVTSTGKNWQPTSNEPNLSSLDLSQQSSGLLHSIGVDVVPFPLQTSVGLSGATSMGNMVIGSDIPENMLISEEDCSRLIYPEEGPDGSFNSESLYKRQDSNKVDGSTDLLLYQSPNCRIPHTGTLTSQSYYSPSPGMLGTSCDQSICLPSQLPRDEGTSTFSSDPNQCYDISVGNQDEIITFSHDGFHYTNGSCNYHFFDGQINVESHEERDQAKDSSKLVPADAFSSGQANDIQKCSSVDESHVLPSEQQDAGALSYEPPRFPSLDIPFFSCDLIQPGNDMQHEYSPLGIRQLMMSSMNCYSPLRLWDSPSRDDSPEAVLKSAAKTFTCTPSILKKRHRDLVSPLSENRSEKKLESAFSNLSRDFSRLEVMIEESGNQEPHLHSPSSRHKLTSGTSIEDKENLCHTNDGGKEDSREWECPLHNKSLETSCPDTKAKDDACAVDGNAQQSSGILVEQNRNDLLLFSPDKFGGKPDTLMGTSARTLGDRNCKSIEAVPIQGAVLESSSENIFISPRTVCGKKGGSRLVVSSIQSAPLPAPLEIMTENVVNDATLENINAFGETPFKRSFESPSGWKSPWFINSFVPGPRVDTDITIEDIGYFMSPGERSYDALGLMKQLSEHTASAFANAQEILGDETPDSILRKRCSNDEKQDQENCLPSASDVLTEGRLLDFSECGTPGKGTESGRFSSAISFPSPSSYLLKGCSLLGDGQWDFRRRGHGGSEDDS